jgi:photosystem II stability/assembly factor-like uncharacterized protein
MIFGAEEKPQTLGLILLAAFVGLLGWYFYAGYIGRQVSWKVQVKTLTSHDDLFAIDGQRDGNQAAVGRFGMILLTHDGGKTWQEQASGTSRALSAISFADHQHGFIVGSGGTILATRDGGVTWKTQSSGTKEQLLEVYASSPTAAHVVGAFGTLLSTSDGGATWRKHELSWNRLIPLITKVSGILEPNLNSIYFVNPEMGWIVGEFSLVLKTTDGGRRWTSQTYGGDRPQLFAVMFRDERIGWSVGQQGADLKTTDGGQNWIAVDIGTRRNLYGISFQAEHGLIVGEGVVLASQDAGSNWRKLESVPEERWLSGVAIKNRQAIVMGQAGTIRVLDLDLSTRAPSSTGGSRSGFRPTGVPEGATSLPVGLHKKTLRREAAAR